MEQTGYIATDPRINAENGQQGLLAAQQVLKVLYGVATLHRLDGI